MSQIKSRTNKISKITMSTALVASSFSFVAPLASAAQFSDVKQSNSHYDAIINLAGRGIINGYEDGTFKPGNFVTRAQAAKIIARTLNLNTSDVEDPKFKDVDKKSEYYPYIAALANLGVINGFDGKFNPSGNVTRGQMSKIIARAFNVSSTGEFSFKDVPANHEYAEYISALAENGITLGKEDGKFAMHELVTRGQLTSFVTRAEKVTAVTAITGVIDHIEKNEIQINGKKYKVAKSAQFLTATTNKVALQDAQIVATIKDNAVTEVEELTIFNGNDFDGQNHVFKKLTLNKSVTSVANLTAQKLIHELPTTKVTYQKVEVQSLEAQAAAVAVASLNTNVAIEQQSGLEFEDSTINTLELNAKIATIVADANSTIQTVDAPYTSNLTLNGIFGRVNIPTNAQISGTGSANLLSTVGANLNGITIGPAFSVHQVSMNNGVYPWEEANKLFNTSEGNSNGIQNGNTNSNQGDTVISPVNPTIQDSVVVNQVLTKVKQQLGSTLATNTTTMTAIENLLVGLASDGAVVTLTNYKMQQAKAGQQGTLDLGVKVTKGNVSESYETTITISALPVTEEPNPSTEDVKSIVDSVAEKVKVATNAYIVSNDTTQADVNLLLAPYYKDGVELKLTQYSIEQATAGKDGALTFSISIVKGNVNKTIEVEKVITALPETSGTDNNPSDKLIQDKNDVATVLADVQSALTSLVASNETTQATADSVLAEFNRDGVEVFVSKYSMTQAQSGQAGQLVIEVTVRKGNVIETYTEAKTIAALEVDQQEVNEQDEADVLQVLETVNQYLAGLTVSNHTNDADIKAQLERLQQNDVSITLASYSLEKAEAGENGNITFTVTVRKGATIQSAQFTETIAALPVIEETEPVNDELDVEEALNNVEKFLTNFEVTNATTDAEVNTALANLQQAGVMITLSKYSMTPAQIGKKGSVILGVTVTKGNVSTTTEVIKEMAELLDSGLPENPDDSDLQIVQTVKQSIESKLAHVIYTNDTSEESIQALLSEVNTQGASIQLNNFAKVAASVMEMGSIEFEINITKNKTSDKISVKRSIGKIEEKITQLFEGVPDITNDETILFGGKQRKVEQASVKTMQTLQAMEKAVSGAVQLVMSESNDGETVALQAIKVETTADESPEVLNFADISTNVDVTIIGDNIAEIQNLRSTKNVVIETTGDLTFSGDTNLNNVTLTNATTVSGLVAEHLIAKNSAEMIFNRATSVKKAQFNNVYAVQGLRAEEAIITADGDVALSNVDATTVTITGNSALAGRGNRVAALNTVASSSAFKITVEGSKAGELIIERTDAIVDIQKNNVISKVTVKSNNTELYLSEIGSIHVESNVSYLRLGTDSQKAIIAKLELDLMQDTHIAGNADITAMTVNKINASAKLTADTKITVPSNVTLDNSGAVYTIAPGNMLGRYSISNLPAKTYYALYTHENTPPSVAPSHKVLYGSYVYLDSTVKQIALYKEDGTYLGKIITKPSDRNTIQIVDVDKSSGVLQLNVTAPTIQALQQELNYIGVYTHGSSNTGYTTIEKVFEYKTFPSTFKLTTKTNQPNVLEIPLEKVSSLLNVIVVTKDYVFDSISDVNKDGKLTLLKTLAQHAKTNNDTSILYDYLTTTVGLAEKSYDSIFMNSIIENILNDQSATLDDFVNFVNGKGSSEDTGAYNVSVSLEEFLLGEDVTVINKDLTNDGTENASYIVEGSNLLIKSKAIGTDVVQLKDAAGNISLVEIDVQTVNDLKDPASIEVKLIHVEVNADDIVLQSDARTAKTKDNKTVLLPEILNKNVVIYRPATGTTPADKFYSVTTMLENNDYVYKLVSITPKAVTKTSLNLSGNVTNEFKTNSGYMLVDSTLYFYAVDNGADQYIITDGSKQTAVYVVSDGTTISSVNIASKTFTAASLAMDSIKEITAQTTGTTIHTSKTVDTVMVYASKTSDKASFKVESQDGKVALVNVRTTSTGAIEFVTDNATPELKIGVVKTDINVPTGESIIIPKNAAGENKEDVLRIVGNTVFATGTGKQRIVFTNGEQIDVTVTLEAEGYTMKVAEAPAVTLTAEALDLQNISSIQPNGTSATAVNVNNTYVSITAIANQSGKTEFVVTDSNGNKTVVYVTVDEGVLKDIDPVRTDDQLYRIANTTISKTDLGFMADIQSISERTEVARGAIKAGAATIYATGAGSATFTVLSTDGQKALVNINVVKTDAAGNQLANELVASATVVKHDTMDTMAAVPGLQKAIAAEANGAGIVRVEGNTLYALKEGSVDLAIDGEAKLFYRISVVKNEVTGQYSFTAPVLVSKAVYSATELGLTDITSASSSDETIATVEYVSNKVTITTQSKDAVGLITVTGPNGQAFIYMSKAGQVLTTEIEKATTTVDVSKDGLANVSSMKTWENEGIVRSYEVGTLLDFFVIKDDKTAYKVTDSNGLVTIINLPVTTNINGHREIVPEVVKEALSISDPTISGEIISGSSIRLYKGTEADAQPYAYAVSLGETLVKLSDGKLVNYKVTVVDGVYSITPEIVTNGLTISDAGLGLNGNLTITGIDSTIAKATVNGKSITFHGQVNDGVTSGLVSDGDKEIRVRVEITDGVMKVEPLVMELNPAGATNVIEAINIHEAAKAIAWISTDGSKIHILTEGEFYYVEHDTTSNMKTVKKFTIKKSGTNYVVAGHDNVQNVIKTADNLGLVNALEVQAGYNTDVVYAGMVGTDFVAYQKGTGSTDVTVKDGQGQKTLMHMTAHTTLDAHIAIALKDSNAFTFNNVDYDIASEKILNVTVKNTDIVQKHTDGKLYLLTTGTTYATLDDGAGNKALVAITVTKPAEKLIASVTTIAKTAAELSPGATTVTALPGTQTNASIVRVSGNKVYAVGAGETKVKLNNQIVTVIIKEEANAYSITLGSVANFIEIPIGAGSYTLADVTNTNSVSVIKDEMDPAIATDDKLIISVAGLNGSTDITITDGVTKTVYHVKVENGEYVNLIDPASTQKYVKATETLMNGLGTLAEASDTNDIIQIKDGTDLHLLKEGKATLKGKDVANNVTGLVNVQVTRNTATKYFEATQKIVEKEIKEQLVIDAADPAFKVVETPVTGGNKYTLRALDVTNTPSVYYTANYRIAANTQLVNDEYVLTVEERHKQIVDFESYGLTGAITLHSENEDLAKAEMTANGKLIVYAGAGQTTPTGTTTITVKDASNKQITIKVTRAEDGKITYEVQGLVDAIKFSDINLDTAAGIISVEGYNEANVLAYVTNEGISLAAQTAGTTSLLIKQSGAIKAIVNITVADGKAVPNVVKYDGIGITNAITGEADIIRKAGDVFYAVKEGVALYEKDTMATQLRIVKNTETNLYSITATSFALAKGATNLDLTIDNTTTVNVSNSSIADAYIANNALYIVGKSLGTTDILVTTGMTKAIVHAHVNVDGVTANVVNNYKPAELTGTFEGNEWIQVRNDKLYALAVKTSTIKMDNTLITSEVTRNLDTNEFNINLTRVKHAFAAGAVIKLVHDETGLEDAVIKINGNEVYAKAVGKTQVFENGNVRNIEVIANADGTYKVTVTDAKVQKVISGTDLGLTLSASTNVAIRAITGSNILETQVIGDKLYIYALGTGTAELTIDNSAVVYVDITSSNNVFVIAEPQIAKKAFGEAGTFEKFNIDDEKIRIKDHIVYGLQEGISLVKQTTVDGVTLHKVLVSRENNILKVSSSIIDTDFTWTPKENETDFPGTIVRLYTNKLVAVNTGTEIFSDKNGTYRVTVDAATGDMQLEVLDTTEIDLTGLLTSISGTPGSTLLSVQENPIGTKFNVVAKAEGSEIIRITDGTNTVLVKILVTKDATNKYVISREFIKAEILTTQLGFHPTAVESLGANGIVKIDGSKVIVYPGITSGNFYFKVNGAGTGENISQAIYSLNVETGGVKLENGIVKGYEVKPLHVDIPLSQLGIDPEVVIIDGTAKVSKKVKNDSEVLEVILNNDKKSYIIVRGENNTYKSIEIQANSTYVVSPIIHNTLVLNNRTNISPTASHVKSVNDGTKSILYATGVGTFAYEDGGKLYNAEVEEVIIDTKAVYNFKTATAADKVSLTNPRLVDGELNIDLTDSGNYAPSKIGEAIYAVTGGYKKVDVALDTNNQIKTMVEDVPFKELPNSVVSASIIKAPASIKLDGTTVYGGVEEDFASIVAEKDKVIIISTTDGDGRVTLYKAEVTVTSGVVSYEFKAISSSIFDATGWVDTTKYTIVKNDNETVARIKDNNVYFIGSGDVSITYKTGSGLQQTVNYTVNSETYDVINDKNPNVIEYTRTDVNNTIYLTFNLSVNDLPGNVDFLIETSVGNANISNLNELKIQIAGSPQIQDDAVDLFVNLPEFAFSKDKNVKMIIKKNITTSTYDITFESAEFKFIPKIN